MVSFTFLWPDTFVQEQNNHQLDFIARILSPVLMGKIHPSERSAPGAILTRLIPVFYLTAEKL